MPGRTITLSCVSGAIPGGGWSAAVAFEPDRRRIKVRQYAEGALILCEAIPAGVVWRRCAEYLAGQDEMYAIPAESMPAVYVRGRTGWRSDVLVLAWCRWGEAKTLSYGTDLLTLLTGD